MASTTRMICPAPGKELDWTAPFSPLSLFIYLLLLAVDYNVDDVDDADDADDAVACNESANVG